MCPEKYIEYNQIENANSSNSSNSSESFVFDKQLLADKLLLCVLHSNDENYDELLELLKKNKIPQSGGYNFSQIYVFNRLSNIIENIYFSKYDPKIHKYVDDEMLKKISKNNDKNIKKVIMSQPNYKIKFYHVSTKQFEYPIQEKDQDYSSWLGGNLYKNPKGIWLSCGISWQKFIGNRPNQWSLGTYIYEMEPTNTVLFINSLMQLEKFIDQYKNVNMKFNDIINWKRVKKEWDGMIICPYLGNEIWGKNDNKFGMWGDKNKLNEYVEKISGSKWKNDIYFTAEWYRHWEEASGVIWRSNTGLRSIKLIKKLDLIM